MSVTANDAVKAVSVPPPTLSTPGAVRNGAGAVKVHSPSGAATEAGGAPLLGLVGITKRFGAFTALDEVSFDVRAGEIHCLLGENGAGKSTLCNVVFGVHRPDRGSLQLEGRTFQPLGPAHALSSGIAMVHQHFSLVGNMSAIENMMLGAGGRRAQCPPDQGAAKPAARASHRMGPRQMQLRVQALADEFGMHVDLQRPVEELSVGERQRIEVLKCLLNQPRLLVLDEPTAVLPPAEVKGLLDMCRQVAERGFGVVLVTHKLAEIAEIATRTTVLRRGRVIETVMMRGGQTDLAALVRSMVGREVRPLDREPGRDDTRTAGSDSVASPTVAFSNSSTALTAAPGAASAPVRGAARPAGDAGAASDALRLRNLLVRDGGGAVTRLDVSLTVGRGEIVGLAGVEGNGQSQLGAVLAGLLRPTSGRVEVDGHDVTGLSPRALTARGVGIVPEDRHAVGCHLGLSVAENLFLGELDRFTRFGLLRRRALARAAQARMTGFDIRATGPDARMSGLSGGNQQKVVLARELSLSGLRFLLAAQPTRGLDVGAVEAVYAQIRAARDRGVGVLLVSSELDELLAVADRVLVIYKGRIVGALPARADARQRIGALMSGGSVPESQPESLAS